MKKRIALVLALAMALSMFLMACGGKDDSSKVVGTWLVTEIEAGEFSLSDLEEMTGMSIEMKMIFDEDGGMVFDVLGETQEGTYEAKGGKVNVTLDGETSQLELDGKTMKIQDKDYGTLVLEKQ